MARFVEDLIDARIRVLPWFSEWWHYDPFRRFVGSERDFGSYEDFWEWLWHTQAEWSDRDWRKALTHFTREHPERGLVVVAPVSYDARPDEARRPYLLPYLDFCVVNLEIDEGARVKEEWSEGLPSFDYPADRDELLRFLRKHTDFDLPSARRRITRDEEVEAIASELPMRAPGSIQLPGMSRLERPSLRRRPPVKTVQFDEVNLGASAPRSVSPFQIFVARFAAYTEKTRSEINRILKSEAPSAELRLDLEKCRWRRGARVTVHLAATDATVTNSVQSFKWDGNSHMLRFDVRVNDEVSADYIILRFDVAVEGLPIASLRPEILVRRRSDGDKVEQPVFIETLAPRSAFASYARKDRREVLGRVRSLQIFTGIDVFLDCLSLRPGDQWKSELRREIKRRDIFWLFWSRHAMTSEWVDWEWRTALASKALIGIQPHPLEPSDLAPPPEELSSLQFGTLYEWYLSQLRPSWLSSHYRVMWGRTRSAAGRLVALRGAETPLITRILTFTAIITVLAAIAVALAWIIR